MSLYRVGRDLLVSICQVMFRVRVVGRERVPRRGAYIVAPSHRSILDIPFSAFITRRRIRFVAKKELFASRFGGWLFDALGAIRVERGAPDRAALRASQRALESGEPVAIFPEGTRGHGPEIGSLFDGAAFLANRLGIPIVPVGVGGSEEILPSGRSRPRLHRVAVVVGRPIVPPEHDGRARRSDVAAVTAALHAELQRCFDEARRLAGQ